jgi:hypothetical protein
MWISGVFRLSPLYPLAGGDLDGAAVRWQATFRRPGRPAEVKVDGMDRGLLRDRLIALNEVQFDRGALLPLLSEG